MIGRTASYKHQVLYTLCFIYILFYYITYYLTPSLSLASVGTLATSIRAIFGLMVDMVRDGLAIKRASIGKNKILLQSICNFFT